MVEDLLQIDPCIKYAKTPLQILDGITVNQPKRILPLTKEALEIAENLRKEQQAAQWAGLPHEKLVQDCFLEQLSSLQLLEQLAPLHSAKEYLLHDIINILEFLGKADDIPFIQLYTLTENCVDRYYTNIIKTLTQLLKQSFGDQQTMLVNSAQALKFLESYSNRQAKLWKVLAKYHSISDHFHDLKTSLNSDFNSPENSYNQKHPRGT